jgi:hypothetical protein
MKRKGTNIITDQDIDLTAYENQDKTLSEVLTEHKQDIEQLKSNVKFIYKYGGIGSGSGSGSGGGSGTSWKVVITRLDTGTAITSGSTLNFGGPGNYSFAIQIYGGGSSSFRITYNWTNTKGTQTRNSVVSVNEGFNSTQTLLLDQNGTLSITILNQDTQEPIVYTIPYITTSYTFDLYYVYKNSKTRYTPSNNNIYMSTVLNEGGGLMAALTYSLAVNVSKATYKYVDWEGHETTIDFDDPDIPQEQKIEGKTTKTIYLDLHSDIVGFLSNNGNARYIQFPLDIDLILEGSTVKENINTLYLKDNLIPSDMYLKVTTSAGSLYDDNTRPGSEQDYPESGKFNLGSSVFQLTPYYGSLSPTRKYQLVIKIDDVIVPSEITSLSDQTTQAVSVPITQSGERKITFSISAESQNYSKDYYVCARESTSSFNWYPDNVSPEFSKYYRRFINSNINNLNKDTTISMTVNSNKKTYDLTTNSPSTFNDYDQLLSIGFQYSEVNDTDTPLASFNTQGTGKGTVFIYQNKIVVSSTDTNLDLSNIVGDTREIFLPMVTSLDDSPEYYHKTYHILSIYKRFEYREGNNYWKGIYIYLDGVLEGVFGSMTTEHKQYYSVSFYPGNYYINLIESTSFLHVDQAGSTTWMEDNDLMGYFYSYKEKLLGQNIEEYEKTLYNSFKTFTYDSENYVHTNDTAIENIAINSKIPTIVINYVDNSGSAGSYTGWGVDNFKRWMEASHGENDDIEKLNVTVQWAKGDLTRLSTITKGESELAQFKITMQGSSTLGYRCKNWELIAPDSTNDGMTCIYSPNFDSTDSNTFLPEESFTLKADVVDSSHTNNNAMGTFINTVTTHFSDAQQQSSPYSSYIKNCLIGFPVLVFLHTRFKSDELATEANMENFYFLGIYNFNLGRKSYFNLGYKDTSKLAQNYVNLQNGFKIYEIKDEDNTLLPNIRVGEIQGNNKFFDFSQYDQSILFKDLVDDSDSTYMFGDFVDGTPAQANIKGNIIEFVRKVALAGGYTFKEIGKQFSDSSTDNYGYDQKYSAVDNEGTPMNQVPNYRYQATRYKDGASNRYEFNQIPEATQSDLKNLILVDDDNQSLIPALDYTSLCEYYTTCMAFGLVDSVQKNLNIKSWNDGATFHIAFYDMDTCLGVSNAGSRINYFAFSDYWKSDIVNSRLQPTTVYRDFSPIESGNENINGESTSSFFDVPSSYLFAIAKYAYSILDNPDLLKHPSNIWAIWRSSDQIGTDPQRGCLANADYFMETYYNHHLDDVPGPAFNFNYRYKYFVVDKDNPNKFDDTNFPKFYGRKQAYTRDWVNGRLHILDAYFNINGISDVIGNHPAPKASSNFVDRDNPDIYVLKDIFSAANSQGNQYANLDYDVTVKARPYAPLIVDGANDDSRYIFPGVSQDCIINLMSSGMQYVLFGGSSLWTELSTINPFITLAGKLTVNSDYFTSLIGNAGICSSWAINTPSLKTISLVNNGGYTGILEFSSPGSANKFPNLQEVRIDNTGIQLNINRSTLTTVSALNMRSSSALNIQNVATLTSLAISGSMSSLTIPAWKSGITLPTTYSSANTTAYLNCSVINITNNPDLYPNNVLRIYNNDTLTELNFSGFESVYVVNCPRLTRININDTEEKYLKTLSVIMPSSSNISDPPTTFRIGTTDMVADLSGQSKLETVVLRRCLMETVKLPDKEVTLNSEAFRYCSNLKYLHGSGSYKISGTYIFADCPEFTMRQSENGNFSSLVVPEATTSLNGEFYITDINKKGHIEKDAAINFLDNCCINAENVRSIVYLFENQNISYTKEDFIEDYSQGMSSLKLYNFPKCSDISRAFYNNPIDAHNRYMYSGLGRNISGIKFSEVIGEDTRNNPSSTATRGYEIYYNSKYHVIYTTPDFLAEVIDNISSMSLRNYNTDGLYYYFLDKNNSYSRLDEVVLKDVFNPEERYPGKLSSITQFEVFPAHTINFTNWFNENWTSISISTVFYYGTYPNVTPGSLEGLLKPLTLKSVTTFLTNISNYSNDTHGRVNMKEFIDWENINQVTNLFLSTSGYKSLGFDKYVTYDDFHYIWSKLLSSENLTGLASLFERCLILGNTHGDYFTLTDSSYTGEENTRITQVGWLFRGCIMAETLTSTSYDYWNINHDFLKYLPNLRWVGYMFDSTLWEHTIPFDFFRKRKLKQSTVYVSENGEMRLAKLNSFTYERNITNFTRCFADIRLKTSAAFDPDALYNLGSVKYAYVKRVDDEGNEIGDETYQTYYSSPTSTTPITLTQPEEIQDIEFAKTADIDYTAQTLLRYNKTVTNYSVSNYQGLFVAPDVLYGSSETTGYISSCFAAFNIPTGSSVFTGIIPNHFLKNVNNWQPSNVLASLSILPFKFAKYVEENTTVSCYRFVPKNYTRYQNLENAFNFRLFVPAAKFNDLAVDETRYFILLSDSIPGDTSSLENAFPNTGSNSNIFGQNADYPNYYSGDSGIRFNIMGTPVVAPEFNEAALYTQGSYIIYENKAYRFKTTHNPGSIIDLSKASLIEAEEFDSDTNYQQGDYVIHDNKFYIFNEAHIIGSWNENQVTLIEADKYNIALDYQAGDYVIYDNKLYMFNENQQAEVDLVSLPGNYYNVLPGLNLNILSKLKLDNVFNPDIMALSYGYLFTNNNINWNLGLLRDISNYCIHAGYGGSRYGGISYNIESKFPPLNNNFITRSGDCRIKKKCISNFDQLDTSKYPSIEFID